MRDARGNWTSARSTDWIDSEARVWEATQAWEYDDANRLEICTRDNRQVNRWWHDEQGREIKYDAVKDSGINTFYHIYTDITRR